MFTAISLYRKSLKCLSTHEKANFNLATCLCELGTSRIWNDKMKAFYAKALKQCGIIIHKFESFALSLNREKDDGTMPRSKKALQLRKGYKSQAVGELYTSYRECSSLENEI